MAVVFKTGSIFDSKAECIVNPTNSVGVMGGGLARAFMKDYPVTCNLYNEICKRLITETEEMVLMDPWINPNKIDPWYIMMFATKIHYANYSKYEYLETGLPKAITLLDSRDINSCAWPLLGAGLGGLDKDRVIEIMTHHLEKFEGESEIWII